MLKEIITVANQKGGVAKSTTVNALGLALQSKGRKVLFIDLDPQCNLTYTLGGKSNNLTVLELLTGTATAKEVKQEAPLGDLIPATPNLSGADAIIKDTGKEYRLKEALEEIQDKYDYILIDTPPALGILTINALTTCNSVIIPAQADAFSLQGIASFKETYEAVKKYCNKDLTIKGILLTRYNGRAILSKDVAERIGQTAEALNTKLFETVIRENIAIKEAQIMQENLFTYAPKSNGAVDYLSLMEEIIGR